MSELKAWQAWDLILSEENTKLREQLRIAKDALGFYADKNNWAERWRDSVDEESCGDVNDIIVESDIDLEDEGSGPVWTYGGKRARETMKEIEAVK